MRIGVAKEIKPQEYRVALTPAGARELVQHGHECSSRPGPAPAAPSPTTPTSSAAPHRLRRRGLGHVRPAAEGEEPIARVRAVARGAYPLHVPPHRRRRALAAGAGRERHRRRRLRDRRDRRPPPAAARADERGRGTVGRAGGSALPREAEGRARPAPRRRRGSRARPGDRDRRRDRRLQPRRDRPGHGRAGCDPRAPGGSHAPPRRVLSAASTC